MTVAQSHVSTVDMTREDWLRHRKNGIGASEIGSILGLNPYRTAYDVFLDKITPEVLEDKETTAMVRGRVLEEYIADRYAAETGKKLRRDYKYRWATGLPLFCSLDRTIVGGGILEVKSVGSYAAQNWTDTIPLSYYAQLQQQLLITGQTVGEFAVLSYDDQAVQDALFGAADIEEVFTRIVESGTLLIHPFEANPEFQQRIIEEATAFWKCVETKTPPPMNAVDYDKLMVTVDDVVESTEEIRGLLDDLKVAQSRKKESEEVEKSIKDRVKEFMGTKTVMVHSGIVLATYKTVHKEPYEVKATDYRVLNISRKKSS